MTTAELFCKILELSENEETWTRTENYEGEFIRWNRRVGEVDLAYNEWNPLGAKTVVLLHGLNVQQHTWDPIASVLSRQFRVLTIDLRGHGESSWVRSGYQVRSMADDVLELLAALNIVNCILVGHSLGAQVSMMVAADNGSPVTGLVLSDTGPEIPRAGGRAVAERATKRLAQRGFDTIEEVKQRFNEDHPEWKPVFRALHARYQVRRNWAGKLVFRSDPELFWLYGTAGRIQEPELWGCTSRIECPVQFMWGSTSAHVDENVLVRLRQAVQNFRDVRIESGHFIPRERPQEFINAILEFIVEAELLA